MTNSTYLVYNLYNDAIEKLSVLNYICMNIEIETTPYIPSMRIFKIRTNICVKKFIIWF